jgi:4-hydroxy-L-threonine phosphate dehydrogenase PdxA
MDMATTQLPHIAIASGDPAGIGPEISLKAAADLQVRRMCRPLVVGDPMVLETHAAARVTTPLHVVTAPTAADWTSDAVNLLAVLMPGRAEVKFATNACKSVAFTAFRVTRRYFSRSPPQDASELRLGAGQLDIPTDEGLGFVEHKLLLPSQPT